jgi:hypothetical protein
MVTLACETRRRQAFRRRWKDAKLRRVEEFRPRVSPDRGLAGGVNADFRGQENNQSFRGRKPRFYGDSAKSALGSLIVFPAQNDFFGFPSTLSLPCLCECIPGFPPLFSSS